MPNRSLHGPLAASIVAVTLLVSSQAIAADRIGATEIVVRDVAGDLAGTRRDLVPADPVHRDEAILTGPDSTSLLRFADDTTLTVGSNSAVTLDRFVYDDGGAANEIAISLGKGILRFVTGRAPSASYRVETVDAVIGVRGTSFLLRVAPEGGTEIFVEEGTVVLTARTGGESGTVGAGSAATSAAPATPTAPSSALATAAAAMSAAASTAAPPARALPRARLDALATAAEAAAAAARATPAAGTADGASY